MFYTRKNTETSKSLPTPLVNKANKKDELSKYKLPKLGEVPEGEYFAEVIHAKDSQTNAGAQALTVYFKIRRLETPGTYIELDEEPLYYIIQKYLIHLPFYDHFYAAMKKALEPLGNEPTMGNIIGVHLFITLSYKPGNTLGGITKYVPYFEEDDVEEASESEYEDIRQDNFGDDDDWCISETPKYVEDYIAAMHYDNDEGNDQESFGGKITHRTRGSGRTRKVIAKRPSRMIPETPHKESDDGTSIHDTHVIENDADDEFDDFLDDDSWDD